MSRPASRRSFLPPGGSYLDHRTRDCRQDGALLGEKVVVDYRLGADGTVGTKAVAKSDPDG